MKQKKKSSILRKFLVFNLVTFSILSLFTIFYLNAIQPNLVKKRVINHKIIIDNTLDHFERLKVKFQKAEINKFLLSTGFLFQGIDRVQFYSLEGKLIGDTNILDLDQRVFSKDDLIIFENTIDKNTLKSNQLNQEDQKSNDDLSNEIIKKISNDSYTTEKKLKNNFYVNTYNKVLIEQNLVGYIKVSEEANDILIAVDER